ncbi:MAG: hypothetical protein H6728_11440 [Myxococcales bacterium]|nr:hypothetical protein [Myxococcales bacterium]
MNSSPLLFLARLEVVAFVLGIIFSLTAWWWSGRSDFALAVWLGSLFSSGNLRLLVWSWSSILTNPSQPNTQTTSPQKVQEPAPTPPKEEGAQAEPNTQEATESLDEQTDPQEQPESSDTGPSWRHAFLASRFLFKQFFLLGGLAFCLWSLQLDVAGFSLGLGNIVIAIVLSPLLPQSTE